MSDEPHKGPQDDVGAVGEEALKLLGALADLARQHSGSFAGATDTVGDIADHATAMAGEINDHLATDAAECRYCPVCRVVHAVRQTSPEVRTHLMVAASSLVQAAAGFLETLPQSAPAADASGGQAQPRGPHVERIDLDDGLEDGLDDGLDDEGHDGPDEHS